MNSYPYLATDGYKVGHALLYPKGTQKIYETLVPRENSYFPWDDKMVVFGYEYFMTKLAEDWRVNFFNKEWSVIKTNLATIGHMFDKHVQEVMTERFRRLHMLGYLPIKVKALPEGTLVPMRVPVLSIENTHDDFYWLPGFLETTLLSRTFVTSTNATVARQFRKIGQKYADLTADNDAYLDFQFHDFSQRGQHGDEAGVLSGIAHLTSFLGTDVVPAVHELIEYNGTDEQIGATVLATEHSIMEVFGTDQFKAYEELIDANPNGILSVVSDTYDYWEVIDEVLPALHDKIMARDGKLVVRPDSESEIYSAFSNDTSVLTDRGYVNIESITPFDKVATVNSNGEIEYQTPNSVKHYSYNGQMYNFHDNFKKMDIKVTKDYLLGIKQKSQKDSGVRDRLLAASEIGKGNWLQFQERSAKQVGSIKHLTPFEKLLIAYQADGNKLSYSNSERMVFRFSKQRKIDKMKALLDELGYEYVFKMSHEAKGNWAAEYVFNITVPRYEKGDYDTFKWVDIKDKNYTWFREFIEELSNWDSSIRPSTEGEQRIKYDSTDVANAEKVQQIATLAGYGAYLSHYTDSRNDKFSDTHTVHIMTNNKIGGQSRQLTIEETGPEKVSSIIVPNHSLIIKRGENGIMVVNDNFNEVTDVCQQLVKTIDTLYSTFGGTTNSKGYKVLDPHVGVLHGEGVTLDNVSKIFDAIMEAGFSTENIVLGVGAYVYSVMSSRDSFGQALKASAAIVNDEEIQVFKKPKSEKEAFKQSPKGAVAVIGESGSYELVQELTLEEAENFEGNRLMTIFDGGDTFTTSFDKIRQRIKADLDK